MKNLFSISFLSLLLTVGLVFLPHNALAQKSIFDISNSVIFSNDNEFLHIDQAFVFNFLQKDNTLSISFDIAPDYYLYRHQFKFIPTETIISAIDLPPGIDHEDEFFGVQKIYTDQLTLTLTIEEVMANASIQVTFQGCAEKGLCYPPTSKIIDIAEIKIASVVAALPDNKQQDESSRKSEQHQLVDMLKQESLLLTLVAFFVGGLLLSFTPCVFPMYPILTGIIVGQGKQLTTRKAFVLSFVYVQGMAITYTLLGIVVALAGAKFQALFQHPFVLIGLSALFIFLALSMFGLFNLALPSSWQNKLNNLSNKQKGGSIAGVLMMGVLSGLVASPCTTAPLTGALLYISQTGDIVLGASALYALSLGMGLPLLVLGSSGGKLLPKAGAWMNIIKNIFGLLLLAVPIFLLERFIPEIASQLLWALLILASASYFYVVNQVAKTTATSPANLFWYGVRSLLIFLALFFGANFSYQIIFPSEQTNTVNQINHDIFVQVTSLTELTEQISQANAQQKTVMVDLYADWCIACKEFEKYTFFEPEVKQALANSVWIQVDLTDFDSPNNAELVKHFTILGLPSILFFDLQGQELTEQRTTGFMDAEAFATHVNKIF